MMCRQIHIGFGVAALAAFLESSSGVHLGGEVQKVQIGPHGHAQVLAHETTADIDADESTSLLRDELSIDDNHTKRMMREERKRDHHRKSTMLERKAWAQTHGNLFATHRLLRRAHAWSAYFAPTLPNGEVIVWKSSIIYVFSIFGLLGFIVTVCVCIIQLRFDRDGDGLNDETEDADGGTGQTARVEHDFKKTPDSLAQDLYGMGIAAIIRDTQRFAQQTEAMVLRIARLGISLLVMVFCMTLQVFLLYSMKMLVTVASNKEAQDTYEAYEQAMYDNNTWQLENGQHRGTPYHFVIGNFATLSDELKNAACQIPLSQPTFFIAVLLVWSLVCLSEIRASFDLFRSLIMETPTIASMKDCMTETAVQDDEAFVVIGLTVPVKLTILVLIIIPRTIVSSILLWLGCRWLTGTFSFSDVMQNGTALTFILLLKDSFYATVVPYHNKQEAENTKIMPFNELETPSSSVFLGSFTWGLVAMCWVLLYITKLQQVLPEYQWDIHDACVEYLLDVENTTPGS